MTREIKVLGMTLDKWIEHITQEVTFHANDTENAWSYTPVISEEVVGDGLQIIFMTTYEDSPYKWFLRIDSKTKIHSQFGESIEFDEEEMADILLEEFGHQPETDVNKKEFKKAKAKKHWELDQYENYQDYRSDFEYPRMNRFSALGWGTVVNMITGEYNSRFVNYTRIKEVENE
jgi:hypothetical protein